MITIKNIFLMKLRNKFSRYFRMPDIFILNKDWFDFFETNNFDKKFIIDDLNFSNLDLLVSKFPIQLKIRVESDFNESDVNNIDSFLIKEIQIKFIFYTLMHKAYSKCVMRWNESIQKNGCDFF